ncbi:MAG: GspE/PulE/PilB domain-containing protein [Myxococcaceae bacterium]
MSIPTTTNPGKKRRLGEILRDAGVVTEQQLSAALQEQRKWGGKLGRTLVEMGFVDEDSMTLALSRQLNLPLLNLDKSPLPAEVVQWLRVDLAERYGVFPLGGDRKARSMQVATSDPTNIEALQELAFSTGMKVSLTVSSASGIDRAIRRYYYGESTVSSPTATPQSMGLSENTFDPELFKSNGVEGAPSLHSSQAPAGPDLSPLLAELAERLTNLEAIVGGQARAMRGILELLVEKGLVSREEYLARVRRGQ